MVLVSNALQVALVSVIISFRLRENAAAIKSAASQFKLNKAKPKPRLEESHIKMNAPGTTMQLVAFLISLYLDLNRCIPYFKKK
jgi:hypothetical protein